MDISLLSMNMSQMNLEQNVGISLLKMNMQSEEQTANAISELASSVYTPEHLGNSIDEYV